MALGETIQNLLHSGRLSEMGAAHPSEQEMTYSKLLVLLLATVHSERSRNQEARWISKKAKRAGRLL
jgi:hypothetical protein